ncbi:MAG: general secretion pathway protein GspK [Candidatus Rokuibacteriota bacterium]
MTRRPPARRIGDRERGVALVIVLIVLALLMTMVGEFALAMRLEGTTTLNFRAAVAATRLAEAAYQRAVAEILPEALAHQLDAARQVLIFRRARIEVPEAPERREIPLGPGRFSYRITDEEARINVNRAPPELLHRLLIELDVERQARDVIVDSIQDWRDQNEEHRLNGAESDHYLGLPVPYRSKNADFEALEELLQVHGITPEIFHGRPESPGLVEFLTVVGSGAINVNTASETVLRAIGYATAEVELLKAAGPHIDLTTVPSNLRGRGGLQQRTRSETFRIEATGEVPGQGRRTLVALVRRQPGRDGAQQVVRLGWRWLDEDARPSDPASRTAAP